MNRITLFFILILVFSGAHAGQGDCNGKTDKQLKISTICFFFEKEPINKDSTELRLVLFYKNNQNGEKLKISDMPYMAATGEIESIFSLKDVLFVIHKVDINAYAGVVYSSMYYTVMAFNIKNKDVYLEKQISRYFGYGADFMDSNIDKTVYVYPYKTKESIEKELGSREFTYAVLNKEWKSKIKEKSYFYKEPNAAAKIKSYLVKGDIVKVMNREANWCRVEYKGKSTTTEWLFCDSIERID